MSLAKTLTKYDRCVYWAPNGTDFQGQPKYAAPIELGCRWEDRQEILLKLDGSQFQSNAKVWVSADVQYDGILRHAKLVDVPASIQQKPTSDLVNNFTIKRFDKFSNLRNKKIYRTAYL